MARREQGECLRGRAIRGAPAGSQRSRKEEGSSLAAGFHNSVEVTPVISLHKKVVEAYAFDYMSGCGIQALLST